MFRRPFITLFTGIALLGSATALAETIFPDAASIVGEAQGGRMELLRAISRLEMVVPSIPDKETTISYLRIVDDLEKVAREVGFAEGAGDPLFRVKNLVADASVKWLNLGVDPMDDILLFSRIASDSTMYTFMEVQSTFFASLIDKPESFAWAYHELQTMVKHVDGSNRSARVKDFLQIQQGEYLGTLLRIKDFPISEMRGFFNNARSEAGVTAILNRLWQSSSQIRDLSELRAMVDLVIDIYDGFASAPYIVPFHVRSMPGSIVGPLVDRILVSSGSMPTTMVPKLFSILDNRQVDDLLYRLQALGTESLSQGQIAFATELALKGAEYLEAHGLVRQSEDLERYLSRIMIMSKVNSDTEGVYEFTSGGVKQTLTLMRSARGALAAGIGSEVVNYAMPFSFYERRTKTIVVSRYYQSAIGAGHSGDQNYTLHVHSAGGGRIDATFNNGVENMRIRGTKVRGYKDYLYMTPVREESVNGTYEGRTSIPALETVRLILNKTGDVVNGSLTFNRGGSEIRLAFANGTLIESNNVIYLTGGESQIGTFVQIRGQVTGGTFRGEYLVGGQNKVFPLTLSRR